MCVDVYVVLNQYGASGRLASGFKRFAEMFVCDQSMAPHLVECDLCIAKHKQHDCIMLSLRCGKQTHLNTLTQP